VPHDLSSPLSQPERRFGGAHRPERAARPPMLVRASLKTRPRNWRKTSLVRASKWASSGILSKRNARVERRWRCGRGRMAARAPLGGRQQAREDCAAAWVTRGASSSAGALGHRRCECAAMSGAFLTSCLTRFRRVPSRFSRLASAARPGDAPRPVHGPFTAVDASRLVRSLDRPRGRPSEARNSRGYTAAHEQCALSPP
jgi:hypothetical protein